MSDNSCLDQRAVGQWIQSATSILLLTRSFSDLSWRVQLHVLSDWNLQVFCMICTITCSQNITRIVVSVFEHSLDQSYQLAVLKCCSAAHCTLCSMAGYLLESHRSKLRTYVSAQHTLRTVEEPDYNQGKHEELIWWPDEVPRKWGTCSIIFVWEDS